MEPGSSQTPEKPLGITEAKPFPKSAKVLLVAGIIITVLLVYVDIIFAHDSSLLQSRISTIQAEGCIVNTTGMSLFQDGILQTSLNLATWNQISGLINKTLPCVPTQQIFH